MKIKINEEKLKSLILEEIKPSFFCESTTLIGEINGWEIHLTLTRDEDVKVLGEDENILDTDYGDIIIGVKESCS
jgi:hypothetical protein